MHDELENLLINTGQDIIGKCIEFIEYVETNNMTDKQWFINFEDTLNKLSVKDHNKK